MSDRAQQARGEFYTAAELKAKPWLARQAQVPEAARRDPNSRPASAEARAMAEDDGLCDYCREPGDKRSQLQPYGPHGTMRHPECNSAWDAERHGRQ